MARRAPVLWTRWMRSARAGAAIVGRRRVATVVVVALVTALAVVPAGAIGSHRCLDNSTASLSASASAAFASLPVTVYWRATPAPGCWDTLLYSPDGSSRSIGDGSGQGTLIPAVGDNTWSIHVVGAGGSRQLARLTVTVQALPRLPSVAMARHRDGRLEFASVSSTDAASRSTQTAPNGPFAAPTSGNIRARSVTLETNANGLVEMFATDAAGQIWHNTASTAWSQWDDSHLMSVALARNADGRLELFGVYPDGSVWHRWQAAPGTSGAGAAGWGAWEMFDGQLLQVAAETNADGRVELFGVQVDGSIWHRWQTAPNGDSWSAWSQIAGTLSSIAVARNTDGRLEIIGIDPAGTIFDAPQTSAGATTYRGFTTQPGGHGGQVAAEAGADGRIEIVGIGDNLGLSHRAQVSAGSATWTGWLPLLLG